MQDRVESGKSDRIGPILPDSARSCKSCNLRDFLAEKMNCNTLVDLKKCLRRAELQEKELLAGPFVVLKIERYLTDPQHTSQTGLDTVYIDVYQLTVADILHKLKVVVDPKISKDIQNRQLREGCSLKFTKCTLRYDETSLSGSNIVIVHSINIETKPCLSVLPSEMADLRWCPDCAAKQTKDLPLTSSRGYFLNLWSSTEMTGPQWKLAGEEAKSVGAVTAEDIYQVKEIARNWTELQIVNPRMVVRVICKFRLLHYAKPSKLGMWPFQANFTVCDETGVCNLVLWNALCTEYYQRLQEGSVIMIRRFTVKKSYYSNGRGAPSPENLQYYDVDINLNPHHPQSEIQILATSAVPDNIHLPDLEYNFVTRRQLGFMPDNYICDVVGCVTYVGRYERDSCTNKAGLDSGGFWIRRWLHLRDASSEKTIIIEMFRAAESVIAPQVKPGVVLVCRHMKVINNTSYLTRSTSQRQVYITSTINTQLSVRVNGEKNLRPGSAISDVLVWSQSHEGKQEVEHSMLKGYFSYPCVPVQLTALQDMYTDLKIISSDDWKRELTALAYRQHKCLFVQAVMVSAKLIHSPKHVTPKTSSRKRRRKAGKASHVPCKTEVVVVDPEIHALADQMESLGIGEPHQLVNTFPTPYSHAHWPGLQQQLMFPSGELSPEEPQGQGTIGHSSDTVGQSLDSTGDTSESSERILEREMPECYILTWKGLNSNILLNTIWRPTGDRCGRSSSMLELLCMSHPSIRWLSYPSQCLSDLPTILRSATQCMGHRYLLVLDCFRHSHEDNQEVVLKQAYRL
ncbi:RPA-related protein RADX-like [Ylistrum balloti]|uniref:RPA-related protein RADX-like n=1 Tax=Ylistrum balloti TaxID=509963 RepID=UPI002905B0E4|nr:RPA-related protein RADX-like [Ylistrum balloti]